MQCIDLIAARLHEYEGSDQMLTACCSLPEEIRMLVVEHVSH